MIAIESDLQFCACSTDLHTLLGQTIDLKLYSLHILLGFSGTEGEGHVVGLARWNADSTLKRVPQIVIVGIQALHTAKKRNITVPRKAW